MNIAVYCSSSNHIAQKYPDLAYELGKFIAKNGHTLVFGGATGGSMTAVSEGAALENGKIIGVIPEAVIRMGRQSPLCTDLISVASMDERKAQMKQLADLFIALPGSYGTLDELFDVLASGVVGEHKKPVVLFNQDNFYKHLLQLSQQMRDEMFIPLEKFKLIIVSSLQELSEVINAELK